MGHDTREIPASVRVPRADTRWICRSTPIDGPLIATVQAELAEYIRAQRLDRPIVVGHSLGGVLALAWLRGIQASQELS